MCMGGQNTSGYDAGQAAAAQQAKDAAAAEAQRQATVTQDMNAINNGFSGFNDSYFNNIGQKYQDYANPQLADQYQTAGDQLKYALSREGILGSSEGARQLGELQKQYNTDQQGIIDTGNQYANTARSNVQSAKDNLVSQANAATDPNAINSAVTARVPGLQALPAFSPLGD